MKKERDVIVQNKGGIGLGGLLGVLFVGLKLTGVITWSWWYVLLPLYGPILLALFLTLLYVIFLVITKR